MDKIVKPLLGIIGGLGPMSSVYFYELITSHTKAVRDQDHIDIILSSKASTPDRTAYIVGKSSESPLPCMIEEARMLERCGASVIVIPCNTAHYFIDQVRNSVSAGVPSIIEETVYHLNKTGTEKAGILATEGTILSRSYQCKLDEAGISYEIPDEKYQKRLTELIYDDIKSGKTADTDKFNSVINHMKEKGCDKMILGCTELSLINKTLGESPQIIDSLEVLACSAIRMCGHEAVGFCPEFDLLCN